MTRVLSALLMVLTLHLSLVGADVSCAKHDMTVNGAGAMDMGGMSHEAASDAAKGTPTNETPAPMECCRALTSCVTSLLGRAPDVATLPPSQIDRMYDDTETLRSYVVAPETPPPKA